MSENLNVLAVNDALAMNNAVMRLETSNSVETDVWHLVYSLVEFATARGIDFDETMKDAATQFSSRQDQLYLIRLEDTPGPCTVPVPITTYEVEVRAPYVEAAARSVLTTLKSEYPAKLRTTHSGYTQDYIEPDWSMYAAASQIRMRHPEDVDGGVYRANQSFRQMPPVPVIDSPADVESNAISGASLAMEAFTAKKRINSIGDDEDAMRATLVGILEYSEARALDFYNILTDVKEDILYNKPTGEPARPSFA